MNFWVLLRITTKDLKGKKETRKQHFASPKAFLIHSLQKCFVDLRKDDVVTHIYTFIL